jgi:hypothetical protein
VVVMVVMPGLGECRGCKHHQEERCCKDLLHRKNVARSRPRR